MHNNNGGTWVEGQYADGGLTRQQYADGYSLEPSSLNDMEAMENAVTVVQLTKSWTKACIADNLVMHLRMRRRFLSRKKHML